MIDLRHVTKRFASATGSVEALSNVSLKIEAGEIFGVIGRSGAGKSTLIRCINLLERPTEGQVLVDGRDLMSLDAAALRIARREIGMIFQHFNASALPARWPPIPRCCSATKPLRRSIRKPPIRFLP
jgi:D-methionine transport system ATP-binding protein